MKRNKGRGRARKILKTETETDNESDNDLAPSPLKQNVVGQSNDSVTRSKAANNQSILVNPINNDAATVRNQNQLVLAAICTKQTLDAALKPVSIAAADSTKGTKGVASNPHKLTSAIRCIGKKGASSPNRGKEPADECVDENITHGNQHSSLCGEKSSNNNNTSLRSFMSPERLSKQDMKREQALEFHSAEFIQNHLLTDGTPGCGEPKRREEGSGARSFNFTELASMMNRRSRDVDDDEIESSMPSGSVNVRGYYVKKEVATLLEKIIETHGDIGKDCEIICRKSRGLFVEMICSVYKNLEDTNLMKITKIEIDGMLTTVDYLQKAKFDVEWLYQRLLDISSTVLKKRDEKRRLIVEKEREIDWCKEKLANLEAEVVVLEADVMVLNSESDKIKSELKSLMAKSLVHGLLV